MSSGDENNTIAENLFSGLCKIYPDKKTQYGLKLTRNEICCNQLAAAKNDGEITLKVGDIIGCLISTEGDPKKLTNKKASCLTVYAYTRKSNKPNIVSGRVRKTLSVVFDTKSSYSDNRDDAVRLQEKIWNVSCSTGQQVWKSKKVLVLVNPNSGSGKALKIFQQRVVPMFAEAGVQFSLVITQKAGHAYEMMKDLDLAKWYGIVIVSGDGLVYEVVNGLMQRSDSAKAIKTPIGCLPGGSGNALCSAICHYTAESCLDNITTNATYILLKHQVLPLDFVAVETQSGKKLLSFLSVTWGLISDVDIESEKYRFMGGARMTLGTLFRVVNLRRYLGRLSFLPVDDYHGPVTNTKFRRSQSQYPASRDEEKVVRLKKATSIVEQSRQGNTASTECMDKSETNGPVEFDLHDSETKVEVPANSGSAFETQVLPPLNEPVPSNWVVLEKEFVSVGIVYLTHLAQDLLVRKDRSLTEGTMDLVILNHTISRAKLIKAFLDMAEGNVQPSADVELIRIRAFRLEPLTQKGNIVVDGEKVEYAPIQGHLLPGMGRVMAMKK